MDITNKEILKLLHDRCKEHSNSSNLLYTHNGEEFKWIYGTLTAVGLGIIAHFINYIKYTNQTKIIVLLSILLSYHLILTFICYLYFISTQRFAQLANAINANLETIYISLYERLLSGEELIIDDNMLREWLAAVEPQNVKKLPFYERKAGLVASRIILKELESVRDSLRKKETVSELERNDARITAYNFGLYTKTRNARVQLIFRSYLEQKRVYHKSWNYQILILIGFVLYPILLVFAHLK